MDYKHTEDMGEISGFGGGYEAACQNMLDAGVKWLLEHPDSDTRVLVNPHITGIVKLDTEDTEILSKAVVAASGGDCTGAMHHTVMSRLMFIKDNGWEKYCEELREYKLKGED